MAQPDFDLTRAHRWFAVEANNRAWQLVELPARTDEETEQMLHAAHAAWHHWSAIGTPVNIVRAEILLATAHATAHSALAATRHADHGLTIAATESNLSAFDRASLHGAAMIAFRLGGRAADADRQAKRYGEALESVSGDDRPILDELYGTSEAK